MNHQNRPPSGTQPMGSTRNPGPHSAAPQPSAPQQSSAHPPSGPHGGYSMGVHPATAQPSQQAGQSGQPQRMPHAPDRRDELIQGSQRTMFEFRGDAVASSPRGSSPSFIAGHELDLSRTETAQESNLRSGGAAWMLILLAFLVAGGGVGAMYLLPHDREPAAVADAPQDGTAAQPQKDVVAAGPGEPAAPALIPPAAPADTKSGNETKTTPAATDTSKTTTPKTTTAKKPAAPKKTATKSTKKRAKRTLQRSKPPRDPLKELPAPPA